LIIVLYLEHATERFYWEDEARQGGEGHSGLKLCIL